MPTSTKHYLTTKKAIQESIAWYTKTISLIDKQQESRRHALENLQKQLYDLEKDYYNNG